MKLRKLIISISVISGLLIVIAARLMSNKESFDKELEMISESNGSVPVIVDTVKTQSVHTEFSVDGIFSASKEVTITGELEGKIITVKTNEGDNVTAGQVLATLDNTIYKSQLELARYNLEKAEKDMERNEQLVKTDGVTMQQFEDAKKNLAEAKSNLVSAQKQYDDSFIKAPFSGVITKRYVEEGTYLSPGTAVFDMAKINKLKLVVMLTAEEASGIEKGQKVNVSVDTYQGTGIDGHVTAINVKADESGKYNIEIEVNNSPEKPIMPGMFGTALFQGISRTDALVISRRTIAGSIKNAEVFLVKGDSVISKRIEVEPLKGEDVLVTKGLKPGDIVVTSGQINLVEGSKVKVL